MDTEETKDFNAVIFIVAYFGRYFGRMLSVLFWEQKICTLLFRGFFFPYFWCWKTCHEQASRYYYSKSIKDDALIISAKRIAKCVSHEWYIVISPIAYIYIVTYISFNEKAELLLVDSEKNEFGRKGDLTLLSLSLHTFCRLTRFSLSREKSA